MHERETIPVDVNKTPKMIHDAAGLHTISGSASVLRNADVGHMLELRERLADAERERDELRKTLIRLNNAVITRMSADEPTGAERLELLRASKHAREITGENDQTEAREE